MNDLKQGASSTPGVYRLATRVSEAAGLQSPLLSDYAPIKADGPLPPSVGQALLGRIYSAPNPSSAAVLGEINKRFPSASQPSLRSHLDQPAVRAFLKQLQLPSAIGGTRSASFDLCLYFSLPKQAHGVYAQAIQPAERTRNGLPYLEPVEFARRVQQHFKFPIKLGSLKANTPEEHLALFALAFGLLQPPDASALLRPLIQLNSGFIEFFKVRTASKATTPVPYQPTEQSRTAPRPYTPVAVPPVVRPGNKAVVPPLSPAAMSGGNKPRPGQPVDPLVTPAEQLAQQLTAFERASKVLRATREVELPFTPAAQSYLLNLRDALDSCARAFFELQSACKAATEEWRALRSALEKFSPPLASEPELPVDFAQLRDFLAAEVSALRTRLQENERRLQELCEKHGQAEQALKDSGLGADGARAREALGNIRTQLEAYRLEEAAGGLELFHSLLAGAKQAVALARQQWEGARARAELAVKAAAEVGLTESLPAEPAMNSIAECEEQVRRMNAWAAKLELRAEEKRKAAAAAAEAAAQTAAEKAAAEKAAAEKAAAEKAAAEKAAAEKTAARPQLEEDEVIRDILRGQKADVWKALDSPQDVSPIAYLERLTHFLPRAAEADEVFNVLPVEGGDASSRRGRSAMAGWLWTLIRKDVEFQAPQLTIAERMCVALVNEKDAPAAFVLASCLNVTTGIDPILDALYLEAARTGAEARARLLLFMPRWETSGQPLPTSERAWTVALALVEAALAAPEDLESASRATALIHALPGNPPELAALLAEALVPRKAPVNAAHKTSAELIARLRHDFATAQMNQDRWRNRHLRIHEDAIIEQVRDLLETLEQVQDSEALMALEIPDVSEKKVRSAVKQLAWGKEDPSADGNRFQKFVKTLTHYVEALREAQEKRRLELANPGQWEEAKERLEQHRPLLPQNQQVVAQCILSGLTPAPKQKSPPVKLPETGPFWDPEWFTQPGLLRGLDPSRVQTRGQRLSLARQLIERAMFLWVDMQDQNVVRAYFAARRGDQRTCEQILGNAPEPFIRQLAKYTQDKRLGEIRTVCTWAEELKQRADAQEFDASAVSQLLTDLRHRLAEQQPGDVDLEETMRQLSEIDARVTLKAEQDNAAANKLHAQVKKLEGTGRLQSQLARTCIAAGKVALADRRFVTALEAFRLAIDHDTASDGAGSKAAIQAFLGRVGHTIPVPGEKSSDDRRATLEQVLAKLEQEAARKQQDCFNVSTIEQLLSLARQLLRDEELERASAKLEEAKGQLESVPLSDEPTGLTALLAPPPGPRDIQQHEQFAALQREYAQLGADAASVARRIELLQQLAAPKGNAPRAAFLAELARARALDYAYRGDSEASRQCCEALFFLQRRWAAEWLQKNVGGPRPTEDPMQAVVLLISTHLIARTPVEHRVSAADWLARNSITADHMRAALAADTARDHLARLLGVCWALPSDDTERALVQSLHRMSLWEESPYWLSENLAGLLRTEADVNARRQLGYLLTRHVAQDQDWTLEFLEHLARSGRSDEVMPLGEQQTWAPIRRGMATFGRSTGAQRATQRDLLLRLLLIAQRAKLSRSFAATLDGIREALVEMNVPSDPPELHVFLEESHATVDGTVVDFALALENRGGDIIHGMRVTSQSQSQILVGEEEPVLIDELLTPRQTCIARVSGKLRSSDENGSAALGLRISYRGHDERSHEKLLNVVLPTRPRSTIPVLERRTLKQLFSESGNEVVKVGQNFFGRTRELEELQLRLLSQELPEGLVLRGMRRIGKTSLAKVFLDQAKQQSGAATVFVDFKQYTGSGDGQHSALAPRRLCYFLATRILEMQVEDSPLYERMGFKGLFWKDEVQKVFAATEFPSDTLRGMLEAIARQLAPRPVVVVLDELDYLVNYWERKELRQDVYDFFNMVRSLLSPGEGPLRSFRWLLSGSDRCTSMFEDYQNPLYGSITQLPMHPMAQHECNQILLAPFATIPGRPITLTESALREVFEVTGGFPFFVQMLGSRLCNVLLDHPSNVVSRWHVREAVRRSLPSDNVTEAAAPYDKVLEPIKDHADYPLLEYLLSLISRHTTDEEPRVRFDDVLQQSEELLGAQLSRARVMQLCKLLDTYKMLIIQEENGRLYYRVRFPLVRRLMQTKYDYSLAVTKEQALRYLNAHAS